MSKYDNQKGVDMNIEQKVVSVPLEFMAYAEGGGYWSAPKGLPVKLKNGRAHLYIDHDENDVFGQIEFDTDVPQENFLFYTDNGIEDFVNDKLKGKYGVSDVCWSEQGMQSKDTVNFDIDKDLAKKILENAK